MYISVCKFLQRQKRGECGLSNQFVVGSTVGLYLDGTQLADFGRRYHKISLVVIFSNECPSRDVLYELVSAGELPLPQSTVSSLRRERDSHTSESDTPSTFIPAATSTLNLHDDSRPIAGSSRISRESSTTTRHRRPSSSTSESQLITTFVDPYSYPALPMHSHDLGRLPLNPPDNLFNALVSPFATGHALPPLEKSGITQYSAPAGAILGTMPAYSGEEAQAVVSHTPFMDGSFLAQGFAHDGTSPGIATSSEASQLLLPSTSTYATEMFGLTSPTNGQPGSDYEMTHDSLWSNLPSGFE